jgi:serine/threonine protein kinase
MSDADGPLDSLADSILDGLTVDWASLDDRLPSDPGLLAQLRAVAAVKGLLWNGGATCSLTSWGRLTIRERIGRGSFGEVYRAWDPQLDRDVALKLLVPGDTATPGRSSVIEEGRLLARIRHPNVVTIYGAERIDGCIGLWMELVEGRTLEELIAAGRRFTVEEATSIGVEVCGAVAAVHDAGLLHRDIKAHNVMLTEEGRSVLMDFGTGREAGPTPDAAEAGTPLYLAPEVLSGYPATVRSDVYSIGVLLFHLLTGSYPLPARSVEELRRAHATGARQRLRSVRPDVPARLARVIERAIDPDPLRRFDDARALAVALATARKASLLRRSVPAAAVAAALMAGVWIWREAPPVPGPEPRILAVLPFEHLREPDNDYLADGLTQEIIRTLSTIDGVQVRSWTSSTSFRNGPRSPAEVGHRLGVNHVSVFHTTPRAS